MADVDHKSTEYIDTKDKAIDRIVAFLILLYLVYISLYGFAVKFTINNALLFTIKTYIPEVLLVAIIFFSFTRIRFDDIGICFSVYVVILLLINFLGKGQFQEKLISIRDLYMPLFLWIVFSQTVFSDESKRYFFSRLALLAKLFLIFGFILSVVEQIKGAEWTSVFYTGYKFYGQDDYSKIKIAHNLGLLRAPSLTGNYATFGCLSLFFGLTVAHFSKSRIGKVFWHFLALLCIFLSTMKSALVTYIVVLFLVYSANARKKSKIINVVVLLISIMLIGVAAFISLGEDSIVLVGSVLQQSLGARFQNWGTSLRELSFIDYLFPYRQTQYSAGQDSFLSTLDNGYLFLILNLGIIGCFLLSVFITKTIVCLKLMKNSFFREACSIQLLTVCVMAFTTNVFQGRSLFTVFVLFYGFFVNEQLSENEECPKEIDKENESSSFNT